MSRTKLGLLPLSVRACYLLAGIAGAGGQGDYHEVVRLVNTMKLEPGSDRLLERQDFKQMYEEAPRRVEVANGAVKLHWVISAYTFRACPSKSITDSFSS
jgi:hypothetical protein